MDKINDTYRQLSALPDSDLIEISQFCDRIMSERGISAKFNSKNKQKIDFNLEGYLNEDWNSLFLGDFDEKKDYYVYFHVDPRIKRFSYFELKNKGIPFYVGKGKGGRAYSKKRSKPHLQAINNIINEGYSINDIVFIHKEGLSEKDALILESKIINFLGCRSELPKALKPFINGRKQGMLINTDTSARPEWIGQLINEISYTPEKSRRIKLSRKA